MYAQYISLYGGETMDLLIRRTAQEGRAYSSTRRFHPSIINRSIFLEEEVEYAEGSSSRENATDEGYSEESLHREKIVWRGNLLRMSPSTKSHDAPRCSLRRIVPFFSLSTESILDKYSILQKIMEVQEHVEIAMRLGKNADIFRKSIESAGIRGLKVEAKEEKIVLRIEGDTSYKMLKTAHSLVTSSIFIIKSLKEIETLETDM